MKIKEIKVKSIIVKSNLPEANFVINPYIGCEHGCKYCYARFMKRFTGHIESWGSFIDVKINAPQLIPEKTEKYRDKIIVISSTTDPYCPVERKYNLTRQILEKLKSLQPKLCMITKSDLILRDIDLLKQFKDCIVAVSLSFLDAEIRKQLEPLAASSEKRIKTLKEIHNAKITTALFISPIFPGFTNWQEIINTTKKFVDEYWFENLNLYPSIKDYVYTFLRKNKPELTVKYEEIYSGKSDYWAKEEEKIREFCKKNNVGCRIYFHHKNRKSS